MHIGEKIREIREAEGLSRASFAERIGIPKDTVMRIEQGRNDPRATILIAVTRQWPKYAYWLMTGLSQPEAGHISPAIERARKDSPGAEKAS
ncbi:helix-turn-helix domain-containing protein [Nitrococcus mobilis]|uniref:Putative gpC-like protein n=1 Tax=Nitrococcus mobilis Nb-231 TaxID=314278 RepID=A4BPG7_9GAMM|nr:putative gpC-like protein [Nitrococcus mobilis Nb-231]